MTPDLEKVNLEAHVEIEKLREKVVENTLEDIKNKIENIIVDLNAFKQTITIEINGLEKNIKELNDTRNSQIIHVGAVIITLLLGMLGALIVKVLIPMFLAR